MRTLATAPLACIALAMLTASAPAAAPPVRPTVTGPASASPGSPVAFRLQARNTSGRALKRLRAELFLSRNRRHDARDVLLRRQTMKTIAARRTRTVILTGKVPRKIPRAQMAQSRRLFALACVNGTGGRRCASLPLPIQLPNVLLVIADDMGVFEAGTFAAGVPAAAADVALTPTIDGLAADGVKFTHAWSNPVCSPTRATVYAGRYSFATGVGTAMDDPNPSAPTGELRASEVTLADYLDPLGYRSGLFGKWHLGVGATPYDYDSPRTIGGFDFHSGLTKGDIDDYFSWEPYVNGSLQPTTTTYATTRNVDDAVRFINRGGDPWFVTVAFNAPHMPLHTPPSNLLSAATNASLAGVNCSAGNNRLCYKAMVEAMDTELGRLMSAANIDVENTLVIFMGDNGTDDRVDAPGVFPNNRGKATGFEGGIRIPLIVSGPPVVTPASTIEHAVNSVDIFDTVADAVGGPAAGKPHSRSLFPYLQDPLAPMQRNYVYSEKFTDGVSVHSSAGSDPANTVAAFSDGTHKVIEEQVPGMPAGTIGLTHCYDLSVDEFETNDLMSAAGGPPAICGTLYSQMEALLH